MGWSSFLKFYGFYKYIKKVLQKVKRSAIMGDIKQYYGLIIDLT